MLDHQHPFLTSRRRRRAVTSAAGVALAVGASLALAGSAAALPTLSGTLDDQDGKPMPGEVMVSLHPEQIEVGATLPVVGGGSADEDGRYRATITDTATVAKVAAQQGGVVEFWVDSARFSGGRSDRFVRRVTGEGDAMRLVDPVRPAPRVTGTDPDGVVRGGPINSDVGVSVGLPMRTGRPQLVGFVVFSNTGKRTAVLESIRPLDLSPELSVLQTFVAGEDRRHGDAGGATKWPNRQAYRRGSLKPVAGFKVTPDRHRRGHRGTNVAFVVQSTAAGQFGWDYVEVRYRIGDVRYRRLIDTGFRGCFSAKGQAACPALPELPTIEQEIARYDQP